MFGLIIALENVIANKENNYISDFLEPNLSVCITKIDEFVIFVLSFVYDTVDNKRSKIEVSAKWTVEEASNKVFELKDIESKFPQR